MSADARKWNRKYERLAQEPPREPSLLLRSLDARLPRCGRALDLAGGDGRNAIWLAQRGLEVTLADISEVGLQLAQRRAARCGVSLSVEQVDLKSQAPPAGPWDLVVSILFLDRGLVRRTHELLAPGGLLVLIQPTRSNLERHAKPPERYLLEDGEAPRLATGLTLVEYQEGWLAEGRHEALLVARKLDSVER